MEELVVAPLVNMCKSKACFKELLKAIQQIAQNKSEADIGTNQKIAAHKTKSQNHVKLNV